ncbi:hypothetical protein SC499_22470 [Peribacillus simplex]|uniref:hypothetical protein n=1 Tax=Peribacillus simplex TaxID=1478 RepID=UPI00298E7168|nr:hypothetical protein [Peribacillus simplex]MDW7617369.1 hypothetical protein [Peribacillus simplex]
MGEEKPMLEQYKELYAKEYDRLQQMQPKSQEYAQLEKRGDRMQGVGERYEFVSSRIDCEQEEKELLKEMKTILRKEMPPELKAFIERKLGSIEYSNERGPDQGFYAITKENPQRYNALQIDKNEYEFQVKVKGGFPDKEQALEHLVRQQTMGKAQTLEKEQTKVLPKHPMSHSQELSR